MRRLFALRKTVSLVDSTCRLRATKRDATRCALRVEHPAFLCALNTASYSPGVAVVSDWALSLGSAFCPRDAPIEVAFERERRRSLCASVDCTETIRCMLALYNRCAVSMLRESISPFSVIDYRCLNGV